MVTQKEESWKAKHSPTALFNISSLQSMIPIDVFLPKARGHGNKLIQSMQVRLLGNEEQDGKMFCGPTGAKEGNPANLFLHFSCVFTFLEIIKHNMLKMLHIFFHFQY